MSIMSGSAQDSHKFGSNTFGTHPIPSTISIIMSRPPLSPSRALSPPQPNRLPLSPTSVMSDTNRRSWRQQYGYRHDAKSLETIEAPLLLTFRSSAMKRESSSCVSAMTTNLPGSAMECRRASGRTHESLSTLSAALAHEMVRVSLHDYRQYSTFDMSDSDEDELVGLDFVHDELSMSDDRTSSSSTLSSSPLQADTDP